MCYQNPFLIEARDDPTHLQSRIEIHSAFVRDRGKARQCCEEPFGPLFSGIGPAKVSIRAARRISGRGARGNSVKHAAPASETFLHKLEDRSPIFGDDFQPHPRAHLREVDPAKTEARDENIDAISQWLVLN